MKCHPGITLKKITFDTGFDTDFKTGNTPGTGFKTGFKTGNTPGKRSLCRQYAPFYYFSVAIAT